MNALKNLAQRAVDYVKDLYQREPARINAVVLALLTSVGLPLTVAGIPAAAVVSAVLLILLGQEATRSVAYSPDSVKKAVRAAKRG